MPESVSSNLYELHYEHEHNDENQPFYAKKFTEDIYVNVHDDLEILYVSKGCLRLYVEDTLWELREGDAFLINAGSVHFGVADKQTVYYVILQDWKQLCLNEAIDRDVNKFYQMIHGELRLPFRVIRAEDNDGLHEIILQILNLFEKKDSSWKLRVIAAYYTLAALCESNGYLQDTITSSEQNSAVRKNDISLYIQFTRYVKRHFAEPLTIPAIAQTLQVSESQLYKVCKKIQGYPPSLYIINYRLMWAAQMLHHSDKTVTDICYACGFESVSYFITRFRVFYGMTPHQFRSENKDSR